MKSNRNLMTIAAVTFVCLVVVALAIAIPDKGKFYAVEPEITLPEYKTDAGRAIDAYERLMERYMDLAEGHLLEAGADCQTVASRLDSLDSRLEEVSARLARIEKKLGIEPDANSTAKPKAAK
jgi:hypothetical protein